MRRNTDKLFTFVDSLQARPLIIGLSEVWIKDNERPEYQVDGYNLFLKGNNNIRSGGVAIYASNELNCSQLRLEFQTFDALGIQFSVCSKNLAFLCIYRFGFTNLNDFIQEFSILLDQLSHTNLFISGDFNLDILQTNAVVDEFMALLANFGLENLVYEPTRISETSATCIDNIFFRIDQRSFQKVSGTVLNIKISDHCLIAMELDSLPRKRKKNPPDNSGFPYIDFSTLKNLLIFEDWGSVYDCPNASDAFDKFLKILCDHVNSCTTMRSSRCRTTKIKPWMSDHLLSFIRKRNKFCRLAKTHPSNLRLRLYSSKLCDIANIKISTTKKQYYSSLFQENGKDARKNWRLVNEIMGGNSDQSNIVEIIDDSGLSITDACEIANKFNSFFTSVVDNDVSRAALPPTFPGSSATAETGYIINSFSFTHISAGELYCIINKLKNSSSPGLDGITNRFIKKLACFLVDVLSHIFNLSINSGVFPDLLKCAIVVPIFKKIDKKCLNNYRPISLLSVFSKIFEKAVKKRILDFLNTNSILSDMQFGFQKNKNTEMALVSFLDSVTTSIDQGLKASAMFVDLTKAFDRVDHHILLNKLFSYGLRGETHKWFKSYLFGRSQRVRVNGHLSSELTPRVGVPQGSVLGPLLFLVYINDIFKQHFRGSIIAFADDLSFSYAGLNFQSNITDINYDLDVLSRWMSTHNMQLSDKTKLVHFRDRFSVAGGVTYHSSDCTRNLPCSSDSCFLIDRVPVFRYLGLLIDESLNWKEHIAGLKSKLLLVARKLYVLRMYAPNYILRSVYFALVDSLLQYGLACWGGASKSTLKSLYVRQKHIIRIICFKDRRSSSWPIFQTLDILPLQHMFVFKVLRLFFIRSGNAFINNVDFNLRSNVLFIKPVPTFKLELRKSFFSIIAPIMFNNLPVEIRACSNFSVFSKNLLCWLKQRNNIEQLSFIQS